VDCLRILATADFHGNAEAVRTAGAAAKQHGADVFAICGDITHFGSLEDAMELLSPVSDLESPVLFVPGNCDPPSLADYQRGSVIPMHGKCRAIANVNFLGLGGSPPAPFSTPFELAETELSTILERSAQECQSSCELVLLSHSPPRDTTTDLAFIGEHVGSLKLREFIERERPNLVLCGHIHESAGVDKINSTVVVNPGPARDGHYAIVDTDKNMRVTLKRQ
jgi:Icc-related predicted phosphoesterase